MEMTFLKILCLVSSLFLFQNCNNKNCPDGSHNKLEIINISSKTINWRPFSIDSVYYMNASIPGPEQSVIPNSSDSYAIRKPTCWEEYFSQVNNGFQYFLIFDNDTVEAIGWYAIDGTNRGLLKRVKVDLEYLQKNNFTITYP